MKNTISILFILGSLTAGAQDFLKSSANSFKDRYIPGVGLILFDSSNHGIWESATPVGVNRLGAGWNPRLTSWDALKNPELQDTKTWERTVIALRIQDALDKSGKDAGSATFNWVSGDNEEMNLKGAAILDFYLPSFFPIIGYETGETGHGAHLRLGAQIERAFKTAPGMGIDHREYFFGINVLGYDLTDEGLRAAAANEFNFGYEIKDNGITGESSSSWVIEWKPAFRQLFGTDILLGTPFGKLFAKENSSQTTASINNLSEGSSTEDENSSDGMPLNTSNSFIGKNRFSIQPRIEVERFISHAIGREDGFCGCLGVDLRYLTLGDQLTFSYSFDAAHSFDESETHLFHQAAIDFKLNSVIEDLSLNISYTNGSRAPDFVEEELFSVGLGLQF